MGKYFPATARYAKAQEFLELKQGAMTVIEYVARFTWVPKPWPSEPMIGQGCQSGKTDGMFPLTLAQTYEKGLSSETRISGFRDKAVPVSCGTGEDTVYSSTL